MSVVDIGAVSRVIEALLETEGRPILYHDQATGADLAITPMAASSPSGLLPALVVAGEAVWREATGKGFALDIVRDTGGAAGLPAAGHRRWFADDRHAGSDGGDGTDHRLGRGRRQ